MLKIGFKKTLGSTSDEHRALQQLMRVSGKAAEELKGLTLSKAGIDPRLKILKPEPRPYPVLRVISAQDFTRDSLFTEALAFFEKLGEQGVDWHWYIFGEVLDDDYFERLTQKFEEAGWEDNITLCGPYKLDAFINLAMNMDVGLFNLSREPLQICRLEAMQLGLPLQNELDDKTILKLSQDPMTLRLNYDLSGFPGWKEIAVSAGILLD